MNNLPLLGGAYTLLLFLLCFLAVTLIRLAKSGYFTKGSKEEAKKAEEPVPQEKKPEKAPEPIYYIVERKKKRKKDEFSTPKEIVFK